MLMFDGALVRSDCLLAYCHIVYTLLLQAAAAVVRSLPATPPSTRHLSAAGCTSQYAATLAQHWAGRVSGRASGSGARGQQTALLAALLLCALGATALLSLRRAPCAPCAAAPHQPPHRAARAMPAAANGQPPVIARPAVLLFGDSLTERCFDEGGWGAALAHHFARKVDVLNRGFGGYNSRWALPLLDQVLAQLAAARQPVLFATLWLGANDAALPDRSAVKQHVPLPEYTANLGAMVAKMRGAGISRILLITPPAVWDEARVRHQQQRMGTSDPIEPDRTNAAAGRYAAAAADLAASSRLPVLDLHTLLQQQPGWREELLVDGLHFTPAGQAFVGQRVVEALGAAYPELSVDALPNHMPWWDKLADGWPGVWQDFEAANNGSSSGGGGGGNSSGGVGKQ